MTVLVAKKIACQLIALEWESVVVDFFFIQHGGYNFYKRKISKNYWQFIVSNDITSCTFKMYHKER